jgi:hypothetical protein
MLRDAALIFALLMTSAAADDYRSYREAYAGIDWSNSITSTAQCQRRVADLVARFGFTDSEVKTSPWTGDPDLWVKDPTRHFRIAFGCDAKKRIVTINVDSEQNQVGSAADLLDTLINSLSNP